jgi:hypothetical protein
MGLGKYNEKFREMGIDGHMIFELDDKILQDELEVSLKLHRIKILSIVNGRFSLNKHIKNINS